MIVSQPSLELKFTLFCFQTKSRECITARAEAEIKFRGVGVNLTKMQWYPNLGIVIRPRMGLEWNYIAYEDTCINQTFNLIFYHNKVKSVTINISSNLKGSVLTGWPCAPYASLDPSMMFTCLHVWHKIK